MDLKTANKELEKLENEYNYWLKQKESLLTLVMPKVTDIKPEIIQGGKREDRVLKYVELEDEKQINATLDYIFKRKNNLMNWLDNELKIMDKYNELETRIYNLRNDENYVRIYGKKRPWFKIATTLGYTERHILRIYAKMMKKRDNN